MSDVKLFTTGRTSYIVILLAVPVTSPPIITSTISRSTTPKSTTTTTTTTTATTTTMATTTTVAEINTTPRESIDQVKEYYAELDTGDDTFMGGHDSIADDMSTPTPRRVHSSPSSESEEFEAHTGEPKPTQSTEEILYVTEASRNHVTPPVEGVAYKHLPHDDLKIEPVGK